MGGEAPEAPVQPRPAARWRRSREWLATLALAAALSAGIRTAVVEAYWIPSGSMRPTLEVGDRVLGVKFAYWFEEPRRGDVVIFFAPPAAAGGDAARVIKRVVAVAGDEVAVYDGRLVVNGVAAPEPYLAEPPTYTLAPVAVSPGSVFVLGDNRNSSLDSRVWGLLPADRIKAKAVFRYWPPSRFGRLDR
jgi:signal peptidase I